MRRLLVRPDKLRPLFQLLLFGVEKRQDLGSRYTYLLKETFADILDRRQPNVVKTKLLEWIAWARRSRLPAFSRVAQTIRKYLDDIVAYVRSGLSNGVVEGLNTKARLLTRRAYGFHSAEAVLAMIMLCCTGLDLQPVEKLIA